MWAIPIERRVFCPNTRKRKASFAFVYYFLLPPPSPIPPLSTKNTTSALWSQKERRVEEFD